MTRITSGLVANRITENLSRCVSLWRPLCECQCVWTHPDLPNSLEFPDFTLAAVPHLSPRTGAHCLNITRRSSAEVLALQLQTPAVLKEESLATNNRANCWKCKLIPPLQLSVLLIPLLCYLYGGKEGKKNTSTFLVLSRFTSEGHFRGPQSYLPFTVFWCFCKKEEQGLCIDQPHRHGKKPNTFPKRKELIFKDTHTQKKNHTDGWSSWLKHFWKMKNPLYVGNSSNRWLEFWTLAKPPGVSPRLAS